MGFVANAVKSVVSGVAGIFGGNREESSSSTSAQAVGQGAAPAANSAQQDTAESTSSDLAKRKRGKRSLMVNTSDKGSSGTGLNL